MLSDLTDFQIECEGKLDSFLSGCVGIEVSNREISGEREKFIHINLNVKNIEVWVYRQECMFVCSGSDVHFEAADYPNKNKLIDEFISSLMVCVSGADVSDLGSGFIKIFDGRKL